MANRSRVRISGPLAAHVDAFAEELARLGYTSGSASHQLRLLAHLRGWLDQLGRGPKLVHGDLVAFVAARRADGRRLYVSMRGVAPLVAFLEGVGLLACQEPQVPSDGRLAVAGPQSVGLNACSIRAQPSASSWSMTPR